MNSQYAEKNDKCLLCFGFCWELLIKLDTYISIGAHKIKQIVHTAYTHIYFILFYIVIESHNSHIGRVVVVYTFIKPKSSKNSTNIAYKSCRENIQSFFFRAHFAHFIFPSAFRSSFLFCLSLALNSIAIFTIATQ